MFSSLSQQNLSTLVIPEVSRVRLGEGCYKDRRDRFADFLSVHRQAVLLPRSGLLIVQRDPAETAATVATPQEFNAHPLSPRDAVTLFKELTSYQLFGFRSSGNVVGINDEAEYSYSWRRFKRHQHFLSAETGLVFNVNYYHPAKDHHRSATIMEWFDNRTLLKLELRPKVERIVLEYADGRKETSTSGPQQLVKLHKDLEESHDSSTLDELYLKTKSEQIIRVGGGRDVHTYTLTNTQRKKTETIFQLSDLDELTTADIVEETSRPKVTEADRQLAKQLQKFEDEVTELIQTNADLPFNSYEKIFSGIRYWAGKNRPAIFITGICDDSTRLQLNRLLIAKYPYPQFKVELTEKFTESSFQYSLVLIPKHL